MAIGRPDTDAMYVGRIKRSLRAIGVLAVRIDEIHHGENIDQRILREIDGSDLVLTDLTYERPSAYFEAGYAEKRGVPVIYTCRADHLNPASRHHPRVHFDVRQRRIVTWASPTDGAFAQRLVSEVRARTRRLQQIREREHQRQCEEAAFQTRSLDSRRDRLLQAGIALARVAGFRAMSDQGPARWGSGWLGYRQRNRKTEVLFLLTAAAFRRQQLVALREVFGMHTFGLGALAAALHAAPSRQCVVVASLSPVPTGRVESVFREFAPDPTLSRSAWTGRTGASVSHLVMLDTIRSEPQFRGIFRELLRRTTGRY